MKLCLDVGNSQISVGIFDENGLRSKFRKVIAGGASSDELGLFLKQLVRENGHDPSVITAIGFCSVVPDINHSLANACRRYFEIEPFVLRAGIKTGLKIRYSNPTEVRADRIAGAMGAVGPYPKKDLIIIDLCTATILEAVTADREYLGGAIGPGLSISMRALEQNTAGLPKVEILRPEKTCGRSTVESIQSGLYWGHLGMIREIRDRLTRECFRDRRPLVIGTGRFAGLFGETDLFDAIHPDLALEGTAIALELNR